MRSKYQLAIMSYCGKGPVPKGRTRGSAEYCLRSNQVRYYGVKKIDDKMLKDYESGEKIKSREAELIKYNEIVFKHNKVSRDIKGFEAELERKKKDIKRYEKKKELTDSEKRIYTRTVKEVKALPAKITKLTAEKAKLRKVAEARFERVKKAEEIEAKMAEERKKASASRSRGGSKTRSRSKTRK